ncbi:MAG: hypothetical protein DRN96_05260 [Thermoproteota archaeon]|nr:MAG: hypothetical protein DRN96_05260 [Candidatus Korarchaeota archaeon]
MRWKPVYPLPIELISPGCARPKDINLYQATRAANSLVLTSKPAVRRGGVIIIPARCQEEVW